MKIKKLMYASVVMLLCGNLAVAQEMTIIKGEVKGDLNGYKKMYLYGKGHELDSTEIVDGHFQFAIPYVKSFIPLIYDEYSVKKNGGFSIFPILIDRPGTIDIKDIDISRGVPSGKVTGIKSAEEFQQFGELQNQVTAGINTELAKKYGGIPLVPRDGKITPQLEAFIRDQQELMNKKMPAIMEGFIKGHPNSYSSLFILTGTGLNTLSPADLKRMYDMLSKDLQQSEEGLTIPDHLKGLALSETGKSVHDFSLHTANGDTLRFGQLKGKYVIIDFWASWCGPCKASFPHMKEIYKKYKNDKFEIYSISIDKNKADWLKELKMQELPWLQALDTEHIAAGGFAVTAVPTTYLIDPDGKIVMKEIGFNPNGLIEKKLAQLFDK